MKNKKNTKNILIIILILALFVIFYFLYVFVSQKTFVDTERISQSLIPSQSLSKGEVENTDTINVTLQVLGKTYQTKVMNGSTVYEVMNSLKNDQKNNFNFKYKEYPSLGIFINEINEVKNEPNKYWIYYVNGKEAEVGVSSYILKDGDEILWKQE